MYLNLVFDKFDDLPSSTPKLLQQAPNTTCITFSRLMKSLRPLPSHDLIDASFRYSLSRNATTHLSVLPRPLDAKRLIIVYQITWFSRNTRVLAYHALSPPLSLFLVFLSSTSAYLAASISPILQNTWNETLVNVIQYKISRSSYEQEDKLIEQQFRSFIYSSHTWENAVPRFEKIINIQSVQVLWTKLVYTWRNYRLAIEHI